VTIEKTLPKIVPPTENPQPHIYPPLSTRRQFVQASLSALSGLALTSCGWTLGVTPTEDAPKESDGSRQPPPISSNQLYIYTWADYTDKDLLDSFTAQTGIQVIVDIFDSNETMLAKVQAGGGAAYSIIYPSDYMVKRMTQLHLLREIDHSKLQGLENFFDKFQNPDYDPGNRYSLPFTWGTTGLIYNAAKLKQEPEDWDYLWDNSEQLWRRIALMNDLRETIGAGLRSLGYSYNSTNPQEIAQAYEKLLRIKPTLANFTTDGWRDLMLAGDLTVAMGYSFSALEVADENPNLKYVVPKSGTSLWTDAMVIPKNAPNLKAAYAWLNFMLRPEVTVPLSERLYFATPNRAAYELLPPELQENPTLFPPEEILNKCEGILPLDPEKEKEYARYWIKLRSS